MPGDDPMAAAEALVDAIEAGDWQTAEDDALAAVGRVRKARAEDIAGSDLSDGREVRTDGGRCVDGTDQCRRCGRPTVFLTRETRKDGRCAHCRLGVETGGEQS